MLSTGPRAASANALHRGSSQWTISGREAIAGIFRMGAENHGFAACSNRGERRTCSNWSHRRHRRAVSGIREIESLVLASPAATWRSASSRVAPAMSSSRAPSIASHRGAINVHAVNCAALPGISSRASCSARARGASPAQTATGGLIETPTADALPRRSRRAGAADPATSCVFLQKASFAVSRHREHSATGASSAPRIAVSTPRSRRALPRRSLLPHRGVEVLLPPARAWHRHRLLAAHFPPPSAPGTAPPRPPLADTEASSPATSCRQRPRAA